MNIVVTGSEGRMGIRLRHLIERDPDLNLKAGWDKKKGSSDFKTFLGKNVDAVVDFSSPVLFSEALSWCEQNQVAFLSGTTGLSQKDERRMTECSKKIPLFWASNMSMGVALLMESLKVFSQFCEDFDFQIEEFHHRYKQDQPSGTALSLQKSLEHIVRRPLPEVLSVRGGGVFGVHKIWALSEGESLCFEHTALNRDIFASGALKVLKWLVKKSPGLYGMSDFLSEERKK